MALPLEELKRYYNACDPERPLTPDDPRNVNLDERGGDDGVVRGANWVAQLARDIELANRPVCQLFSGLRGSGKSTELLRLAARLRKSANLLPVVIDAQEVLDLRSPIDVPDVLMAMLYETDRVVSESEGHKPEEAMHEGPLTRLWNWLRSTDVELKKIDAGVSEFKLTAELKTNPSLRRRVQEAVAKNLSTFLNEIELEFTKLERRAKVKHAGLVIILDSLEKLQGTSESFELVLDSAERVFANGAPYMHLPVHVLYTVPPPMLVRMPTAEVRFLPMIKLRTRDRRPFAEGFDAAREIVRKRVPDGVLAELFGQTLVETRLRELIEWSGGYPREIVRLMQSVLALEPWPTSERAFHRVLNQAGEAYGRVVHSNGEAALNLLARVFLTQRLVLNEGERVLADRLLSGNLVLRYVNDEEWADVHPAIADLPLLKEAIERQKALRAAPSPSSPPPPGLASP